jgi:hypothetical protein
VAQTAGRIVVGQPRRLSGLPTINALLPAVLLAAVNARIEVRAYSVFNWLSRWSRATVVYEQLSQNPVFGPGSCDLHSRFRGRQAELPEDRKELPHERQQGLQLRKELRLLGPKPGGVYNLIDRKRSAFTITETELKLIAAPAIIGLSSSPKNG